MTIRDTLALLLTTAALCASAAAHAQTPPAIARIIVGFPPGGNIDQTARLMGQAAAAKLGKTLIVESRVGAGGVIAAEAVARAPADGNTLLLASSLNAVLPSATRQLRYDPLNDFEWVGTFTKYPLVVAVPRNSPHKTLVDLLTAARERPGKVSFGSAGPATVMHLVGEMVGHAAKVQFLHVPYKGEAPSMLDAIGGQIDFVVLTAPTVLPRLRSGDLRVLAVTGDTRWAHAPTVPTVAESGYPGFGVVSWVGLAAPRDTPAADLARLSEAFRQAQQMPEVRQQIEAMGVELYALSPAQTRELMRREIKLWQERADAAGVKPE